MEILNRNRKKGHTVAKHCKVQSLRTMNLCRHCSPSAAKSLELRLQLNMLSTTTQATLSSQWLIPYVRFLNAEIVLNNKTTISKTRMTESS